VFETDTNILPDPDQKTVPKRYRDLMTLAATAQRVIQLIAEMPIHAATRTRRNSRRDGPAIAPRGGAYYGSHSHRPAAATSIMPNAIRELFKVRRMPRSRSAADSAFRDLFWPLSTSEMKCARAMLCGLHAKKNTTVEVQRPLCIYSRK